MKNGGIVMDSYKAPTFRKNLEAGGFEWTEHDGPIKESLIFKVKYCPKDLGKLTRIVKASNDVSRHRN